jgi:tetratricopeptide (TPR) repeat protein
MPKYGLHKIILSILIAQLYLFSSYTKAQVHDEACNLQLSSCISLVNKQLTNEPVYSHHWYYLKQNQLDLLYQSQEYHLLLEELNALIERPSMPTRIKLTVLMYKVKLHIYEPDNLHLEDYKVRVETAFKELAQSASPVNIIDYATFQLYTGNYQKGIEYLRDLEKKFADHDNHNIRKKMYTAFGHLSHRMGDSKSTLNYFQKAKSSAVMENDTHYQIMAFYNVARAQQFLNQFEPALAGFKTVVEKAKALGELSYQSLANFRMTQVFITLDMTEQAKETFKLVNAKYLRPNDVKKYNLLQSTIGK